MRGFFGLAVCGVHVNKGPNNIKRRQQMELTYSIVINKGNSNQKIMIDILAARI